MHACGFSSLNAGHFIIQPLAGATVKCPHIEGGYDLPNKDKFLDRALLLGTRRRIFTPLNEPPMPSEVISLHRAYVKNKRNPEYKRRVSSWTDDRPTAVVECLGTFPRFAPHGNDRKTRPRKYVRTKPKILLPPWR